MMELCFPSQNCRAALRILERLNCLQLPDELRNDLRARAPTSQ